MKKFTEKGLLQKTIISLLTALLLFNFIMPNFVLAKDDEMGVGGVLFVPIQYLVTGLSDTVMWLVNTCAFGEEVDPIITLSTSTWPLWYKATRALLTYIEYFPTTNAALRPFIEVGKTVMATLVNDNATTGEEIVKEYFPEKIDIPIFLVSPEKIFANKVPLLDVNVINPNEYKKDDSTDENGNKVDGGTIVTPASALHETIASWYVALRNLAIVGLLSILVYVGIRIILSSAAADKAKYKQMFTDWLVALCILFFIHYIMSFSITMVESLTEAINQNNQTVVLPVTVADLKTKYNLKDGSDEEKILEGMTDENGNIILDLLGLARFKAQLSLKYGDSSEIDDSEAAVAVGGRSQMAYTIIYAILVIYTVMFLFMYIKRLIYIIFLTVIAPLVALTYPIDKMNDGQAQAFNKWLKEYIFNLLLQPLHLILYSILLGSAMDLATDYLIYPLVVLGFMLPAEKILRNFFGFEKSSTASSIAGGALGGAAVMNAISKLGGSAKKAVTKGAKGAAGAALGAADGNNRIRMAERTADNPDGEDDFIREGLNAGNEEHNEQDDNFQDNNQPFEGDNENDNPYEQPNYGESEDQLSPEEMAEQDPNYMYMHPELFGGLDFLPETPPEPESEPEPEPEPEPEERAITGPKRWDGIKAVARSAAPQVGKGVAKAAMGAIRFTAKAYGAATLGTIGIAAGLASNDYKNVLTYGGTAAAIGSGIGGNIADRAGKAASAVTRMPSNMYRKATEIQDTYQKGAYSKEQYKQFVNSRLDREFMKDKAIQRQYEEAFGRNKINNVEAYKVAMEKALEYRKHGVTDNETIIKAMKVKSRNVSNNWDDRKRIISAKLATQVSNEKDVETIEKRLQAKGVQQPQIENQADMIRKIRGLM